MRGLIIVLCLAADCASAASEARVFTLYRSSVVDPLMKIHVATFDADEAAEYNHENCWLAADLFAKQPGVSVRYWCEPGRISKSK